MGQPRLPRAGFRWCRAGQEASRSPRRAADWRPPHGPPSPMVGGPPTARPIAIYCRSSTVSARHA
eukprot:10887318-Alexandrium_andersonii.AAC.1